MQEIYNFDYSKLLGKIKERYGTQNKFAEAMGIGRTALSCKINNKAQFSQTEIKEARFLLGLKENDILEYFFNEKVHKTEQKNDTKVS